MTALTAVAISLAAPTGANAACARVPLSDMVEFARVVATVDFLEGPADASGTLRTPAFARVKRFDKGFGPPNVGISTSLGTLAFGSEGISPKAGERWRIYGTLSGLSSLGTSTCAGSVRIPEQEASASITVGRTTRRLVPASLEGKPHSKSLPKITLSRNGNLTLQAASPALNARATEVVAVLLIQSGRAATALKVSWSGSATSLKGQVRKLKVSKKGAKVVVITREASFAARLSAPKASSKSRSKSPTKTKSKKASPRAART